MSTDTRPSVTAIGDVTFLGYGEGVSIRLDDLPDIGLKDGDEVEVTLKKHERTTGNLLAPDSEATS